MGITKDQNQLVEQAMRGHRESLSKLAEIAREPLRSYVLRIAFDPEIVDDIVQETLLEMLAIFKQLKQANLFWPWLYKIAFNKIRLYTRTRSHHRRLLKSHYGHSGPQATDPEGLAAVIQEEFRQCVLKAMSVLSEREKAVLSMRCYEEMPYAQIAEVMEVSELGCRLLFIRAKKKLHGKLFRLGYGQKSLLAALALFGKLTASSRAEAAHVSLAPSVLQAGGIANTIAFFTGKAALTVVAGAAVVTGAAVITNQSADPIDPSISPAAPAVQAADTVQGPTHINEGYYLFPRGKNGPVLTRLTVHDGDTVVQVLQNDSGNFVYDTRRQAVMLNNAHYWQPTLRVMTLPTDEPAVEAFLAAVENRTPEYHPARSDSYNLFIVASDDREHQTASYAIRNYNALLEERFQYNWPARTGVIDNRDAVHQQGWCCFELHGSVKDQPITGRGRLAFTYAAARANPPWLDITVSPQRRLIDTPSGAALVDASGRAVRGYPAGTFFHGLNRPWSGLHVMDTVRRDAARHRIAFQTGISSDQTRGTVTLDFDWGSLVYQIDMEKDLIDQIEFYDTARTMLGSLGFTYRSPDERSEAVFTMPGTRAGRAGQERTDSFWLSELGDKNGMFK